MLENKKSSGRACLELVSAITHSFDILWVINTFNFFHFSVLPSILERENTHLECSLWKRNAIGTWT